MTRPKLTNHWSAEWCFVLLIISKMTVHCSHAMATSTDRECRIYGVLYFFSFFLFLAVFQIHFSGLRFNGELGT